jgi:CheY-like chemotaxis protein
MIGVSGWGSWVLVVDDDDDVRTLIVEVLSSVEGRRASGSSNGRDALDAMRISARPPSLALIDLCMPVMDGWALIDAMRADPLLHRVPVVVLTAVTRIHRPLPMVAAVLAKPFELELLIETVRKHETTPGGPLPDSDGF